MQSSPASHTSLATSNASCQASQVCETALIQNVVVWVGQCLGVHFPWTVTVGANFLAQFFIVECEGVYDDVLFIKSLMASLFSLSVQHVTETTVVTPSFVFLCADLQHHRVHDNRWWSKSHSWLIDVMPEVCFDGFPFAVGRSDEVVVRCLEL